KARLIMRRMAVLRASPVLSEVPHKKPERRHKLSGKRSGQFAVVLKHPFRLIFKPDHEPLPRKDDGGLDLTQITAIK
ncbi:MAG TPA: system killer suppression protein, partial [Desulfobacteraceae bacterium]|nr:system killer suppression protein [Desulfobacteraceae bacterium]